MTSLIYNLASNVEQQHEIIGQQREIIQQQREALDYAEAQLELLFDIVRELSVTRKERKQRKN